MSFAVVAMLFALTAHADTGGTDQNKVDGTDVALSLPAPNPLSPAAWKVGDFANYKLGGGLGTVKMVVKKIVPKGVWVEQTIDIGFGGPQKVETLYSKANGAALEVRVNGEKQPNPSLKVIEARKERITVPKGTYDCSYRKHEDRKSGEITETWVSPKVSINGIVKSIVPTMAGQTTLELTGYKRN